MSKTNGNALRPKQPKQVRQLDIVGTAEAANILGVERPRIGRWIKRGVMPPTATTLQATPVWHRKDIERMQPWVEANRRQLGHREEPDVECPRCGAHAGEPCRTHGGEQAAGPHMARMQALQHA